MCLILLNHCCFNGAVSVSYYFFFICRRFMAKCHMRLNSNAGDLAMPGPSSSQFSHHPEEPLQYYYVLKSKECIHVWKFLFQPILGGDWTELKVYLNIAEFPVHLFMNDLHAAYLVKIQEMKVNIFFVSRFAWMSCCCMEHNACCLFLVAITAAWSKCERGLVLIT